MAIVVVTLDPEIASPEAPVVGCLRRARRIPSGLDQRLPAGSELALDRGLPEATALVALALGPETGAAAVGDDEPAQRERDGPGAGSIAVTWLTSFSSSSLFSTSTSRATSSPGKSSISIRVAPPAPSTVSNAVTVEP